MGRYTSSTTTTSRKLLVHLVIPAACRQPAIRIPSATEIRIARAIAIEPMESRAAGNIPVMSAACIEK